LGGILQKFDSEGRVVSGDGQELIREIEKMIN